MGQNQRLWSVRRKKIVKDLSKKQRINLLFTNFPKEIKKAKHSLEKNICLQKYFCRNNLFELYKKTKKEEFKIKKWLDNLNESYKEYLELCNM
jgi:hypothetical protein